MADVDVKGLTPGTSPEDLTGKAFVLYNKTTGESASFDGAAIIGVGYKDLSMYSIYGGLKSARETANCYVVRTAGAYTFPCVFGNAVKNGEPNTAAYTNQGGANQTNFVDHLGNAIAQPSIEGNTGVTIKSASVLWSDVSGLITNLSVVGGSDFKYVRFTVGAVPDTGGNALICVKDSNGTIMWTWHIWVYGHNLQPVTIINASGRSYNILPVNIGWKWDDTNYVHGKAPHFQWGRPTPFPAPASYASNSEPALTGEIAAITKELYVPASDDIAYAIKNPGKFIYGDDEVGYIWNNAGAAYNLWNAGQNDAGVSSARVVTKTVYDPSPVGFHVPDESAFTGFTTTGGNTNDATQFNVVGSWANGWKFKRSSTDAAGHFFAAGGCRNRGSGAFSAVGSGGYFWVAGPSSAASGRYLYFIAGSVGPLSNYSRSCGFSVRPVQE